MTQLRRRAECGMCVRPQGPATGWARGAESARHVSGGDPGVDDAAREACDDCRDQPVQPSACSDEQGDSGRRDQQHGDRVRRSLAPESPLHQRGSAPRARSRRRTAIEQPSLALGVQPSQPPVRALAGDPIASAAWDTTYPRTPGDRQAAGLIACTPAAGLDAAGAREGGARAGRASPGRDDAPIPADRRR